MKKRWKKACAGLVMVALLTACAGSSGTAPQGDSPAGTLPDAREQDAAAAGTANAADRADGTADKTGPGASSATAEPAGSARAADQSPQRTLEEVFKNHDSFTDDLSKWNAKAEKKQRSAWYSSLSPEEEQAIIDSMNVNFKRAVLSRAYEQLEKEEIQDGWYGWYDRHEKNQYLAVLLRRELISREKADAWLLARELYAENLEAQLWSEISQIIEKSRGEYPEDFPAPEPEPSYEAMEDGAVYEETEELTADYAVPYGASRSVSKNAAVPDGEMAIADEAGAMTGMAGLESDSQEASSDTNESSWAQPDDVGPEGLAEDGFNTSEYKSIRENPFKSVAASPLSTFSIDVDTAGYTKLKYDILDGYEIEKDEVKIEELINYFNYNYDGDRTKGQPFIVSTEYTRCPWNTDHSLVRIGIRSDDVQEKPATNFVLVTDVSGSMMLINKLPLALSAYADMLEGFDEKDTISLMYYASGQGIVLQNVTCDKKETIYRGLADVLASAGGGTNGALGLQTAYDMAADSFVEKGVNRVLIATDGDFNIGTTSEGQLKSIVEEERKKGIYLTILGYGSENLKDNKMEAMAENGNGNYHYIGDMTDARKALVQESASTLIPMADDVKIQVEFNPALVQEYRLIGYESRILNAEDFNNDKVDAGDVGAGKTVTALYELVPADAESETSTPDLKYSKTTSSGDTGEVCTVSVRYKETGSALTESESKLVQKVVLAKDYHEIPDANTALAISLAEAGMVIRGSEYKGTASLTSARAIADAVTADTDSSLAASWAQLLGTLIDQSE